MKLYQLRDLLPKIEELDKKTHLRAATKRQALADKEHPNQIGKDAQKRSDAHMATYIDKDARERGKRTGKPQHVTHHDFSGERPEVDECSSTGTAMAQGSPGAEIATPKAFVGGPAGDAHRKKKSQVAGYTIMPKGRE
jgi:hypothetical protein